jgi:hypothetical protein
VTDIDKHSSLRQLGIDYGRKKFYSSSPRSFAPETQSRDSLDNIQDGFSSSRVSVSVDSETFGSHMPNDFPFRTKNKLPNSFGNVNWPKTNLPTL